MSESVLLRYVNGKYIRESEYNPPKASARYVDHSWTTIKGIPCGRLRLVVYAPYPGVSWSLSFQESTTRTHVTTRSSLSAGLRVALSLLNSNVVRKAG